MDARSSALVRLQDCPNLGASSLAAILDRYHGDVPECLFGHATEWYTREFGLSSTAANALSAYVPANNAAYGGLPIRMVTRHDAEYPRELCRMNPPPPLLAEHGPDRSTLPNGRITVVCSARWELSNSDTPKAAILAGLEAGYCLVAGHNRAIYQWALLAAKRMAAASIMVLDRGLLSAFGADMRRDPVAAARIWGYAFDERHCLAVSPFRLRDGWAPDNGRIRDAMVAALADTIIVMGMRPGGTIHRLAARALASGQRVFADDDAFTLLGDLGAAKWDGVIPDARHAFVGRNARGTRDSVHEHH